MPLRKDVSDKRRRANINYSNFWTITDPKLIDYLNNGLYVYKGEVEAEGLGTPAQIRSREPLDVSNPLAMTQFEVQLQDTGLSNAITLGVCTSSYPSKYLPGWQAETGKYPHTSHSFVCVGIHFLYYQDISSEFNPYNNVHNIALPYVYFVIINVLLYY